MCGCNLSSCLKTQVWLCFSFRSQMLLSLITFWCIHATQIESALKSRNQRSLRAHVRFQILRFLRPKPPSSLGVVTTSQLTFALNLPSKVPFQRYALHIEPILIMHSRGRIKAADQKFVMPLITVFKRTCLPAKERYFDVQELIFLLMFCRRGSQSRRESFFVHKGRPR